MRAARLALLASLGLSACATGVDSFIDDDAGTGLPYEAGVGDAGSEGGQSAYDGGFSGDSGTAYDSSSSDDTGSGDDTGAMSGDTGVPPADGGPVDTGAPGDSGCIGSGYSGALVTFDLSAQAGNETSVAATTSAKGVTGGALSRSAALTAVSGSGSINASGWATMATADATKYFTFTVTPAAGCTVTLTSLALDVKASSTGPTKGDVATSADAFATHTAPAFAGTATPSVTLSGVSGSSAVEIRVYGYGASSSAGTLRIQNTMTLSGKIQ